MNPFTWGLIPYFITGMAYSIFRLWFNPDKRELGYVAEGLFFAIIWFPIGILADIIIQSAFWNDRRLKRKGYVGPSTLKRMGFNVHS